MPSCHMSSGESNSVPTLAFYPPSHLSSSHWILFNTTGNSGSGYFLKVSSNDLYYNEPEDTLPSLVHSCLKLKPTGLSLAQMQFYTSHISQGKTFISVGKISKMLTHFTVKHTNVNATVRAPRGSSEECTNSPGNCQVHQNNKCFTKF